MEQAPSKSLSVRGPGRPPVESRLQDPKMVEEIRRLAGMRLSERQVAVMSGFSSQSKFSEIKDRPGYQEYLAIYQPARDAATKQVFDAVFDEAVNKRTPQILKALAETEGALATGQQPQVQVNLAIPLFVGDHGADIQRLMGKGVKVIEAQEVREQVMPRKKNRARRLKKGGDEIGKG